MTAEEPIVMLPEGDGYPDTTTEAKAKAELGGFDVLVATDQMLMLDLDSSADLEQWGRCEKRIPDFGVKAVRTETWSSKSGNRHVLIHMEEPMPAIQRVGLEAVLGSDRKRAALAFRGILRGAEFPCMLFRPSGAKVVRS